jgi:acyl-ACP thioesterase
LSYSAKLTGNYIPNLEIASLESFFGRLSPIFLALTIIILGVSVWVAQKDFDNWRSFLVLSPPITFVAFLSSLLAILLILFNMKISQALILIFALAFISPFYIKILNWLDKPKESIKKDCREEIEKYCANWKSFLSLPSPSVFMDAFAVLLAILLIILITQISQVLIFKAPFFSLLSKLLVIFEISQLLIFIFVFSLLCITISTWLKKPIKASFDEIKKDFKGNQKLLKEVIESFYLQLSCNDKDKARISTIKDEVLKKYENDEKDTIENTIEKLIANLDKLKGYLFSMELRLEDDLTKGSDSEELKKVFKSNGFPLPKNSIGVIKGDNKWVITDKERKKTHYIVRKEDGKLKIYNKDMEYLENEDFNIIVAFKYY